VKLTLGICALDFLPTQAYASVLNFAFNYRLYDAKLRKAIDKVSILVQQGTIIPDSRRAVVEKAIELGSTHLLFLDSDIVLPRDGSINSLFAHHKDIVVATYNSRYQAHAQLGNRDMADAERPAGLLPMATVPLGCALIRLSIFDRLARPWFNYELGPEPGKVRDISEDSWFCKQAREAGIKIWLDPSIKLGHVGTEIF
jgi:hypothetical protein